MKQIDFENGRTRDNVLKASLPMLVAQILSLLYSIVDRIYIGRIEGVGTLALSGIGLCFPAVILITAFANLYGFGGAPLCAMERGRHKYKQAELIMNSSFFMLLLLGILLTALGELFSRPLLLAFGASQQSLPYAESYLRIYLLGTIPFMLSTGLNPYINAQGFALTGMLTVLTGALANILLDPLFIFGLHLGIRGAATATVLSQLLSMCVALFFLRSDTAELKLRLLRPSELRPALIREITALGTANFIMLFTNSLVAVACNHMLSRFGGDIQVSVYAIISSVRQMLEVPLFAVANGAGPVMSYNYGARRDRRLKEAIRLITIWGLGYTLVVWVLVLRFPASFIRLFSPDWKLIQAAIPALHIYFFAFIFQVFQFGAQSVFKSLNMKYRAIFFSLFRKIVLVLPLSLLLPYVGGLGSAGVYMAEPVSNVLGGLASFTTMMLTVYLKPDREGIA
ncbi:putative MATE family efflux protein [Moryella indoligenes]|uniref:Multidrug export protein MepA n=1 Tax=Moryella indoligenes TaxID=371674 RepID=A0AAE3V9D2_9FIRM|nr:MATE family efflux transporter [Moryella indoligenes]MDQ0152177.1 putative MATE family efflux protein [Moryella indoligenes]